MFQITLPHSHCIKTNRNINNRFEQICDISSEEIGRRLHKIFYEKKIPSRIVMSHQNRSQVDDNREHSLMEFNTPLHQKVMQKINKTLGILDVHSFYKGAFEILPQIELDGDPDTSCLVIFSLERGDVNEQLYRFLKKQKSKTRRNIALIKSPDIVFILKHYTKTLKVPTFMFEFAEFLPVPDDLLEDIIKFLEMKLVTPLKQLQLKKK